MVSLKKYLVYSFIFVGFLLSSISFASSAVISNSLGYDTQVQCLRNCINGTCLKGSNGKYVCRLNLEIESCNKGDVQYKPSGSCGTASRTCCGDLDGWSDWDKECPKTCDGKKPITSRSCGTNGTQTRIVTCDTSTGKWVEGNWGPCKEQVCTPGEVGPCPTNCYQRRTCNSAGTDWGSCYCENKDEIWNVTMNYKNTVQSTMTCEAHCCCDGDRPVTNMYNKYLNKNAGTGCIGKNGQAKYYCGCKEKKSGNQTYYTGTYSECLR